MFSNLLDLGIKRSAGQAFGFYIIYFIAFVIFGALLGGIAGLLLQFDYDQGLILGNVTAVICCLGVSILICQKKAMFDFKAIVLILLSGGVAIFIGSLGGLIPAAILTTMMPDTDLSEGDMSDSNPE